MSRKKKPEPFFRKFDGWWYVQIGKEQIKLAKGQENDEQAWRAYYRVMAERGSASPAAPLRDPTVTAVCNLFLDFSEKAHKPRTYEFYRDFLEDFTRYAGKLKLSEVDSSHVASWLDRHPDWKGCRRAAVIAVKRAFNYAYTEGKINTNPMRTVKKPPAKARERFLTREERQKIFDNYPEGDCFRDFLFALEHTGCRPGEVTMVTAEHVELRSGAWILDEHKTEHATGLPRVVILTPEMVALTKRLMEKHPAGPLFRNEDGNPWNRNAVRCRFRRVRDKLKLGGDLVAYLYRHAVCTDLLESGTGIAQAAELLGHKSTDMIMRHYNKLRERRQHLRDEITRATRKDAGVSGGTPHRPPEAPG
ncbi:MAG: tyrosine-type recombinase/integrase [Gemmataceae bacterium]